MLLLKVPQVKIAFAWINDAVDGDRGGDAGRHRFVFGYIGGGPLPFEPKTPGSDFILAFQALPVVLVMSVLSSLLFYWRIMPPIVRGFSWALTRTLDVGGAVGFRPRPISSSAWSRRRCSSGPISRRLSRSEMFIVMTGGMAGIAGTVFVLYATILAPDPRCAGHIAVASILARRPRS